MIASLTGQGGRGSQTSDTLGEGDERREGTVVRLSLKLIQTEQMRLYGSREVAGGGGGVGQKSGGQRREGKRVAGSEAEFRVAAHFFGPQRTQHSATRGEHYSNEIT